MNMGNFGFPRNLFNPNETTNCLDESDSDSSSTQYEDSDSDSFPCYDGSDDLFNDETEKTVDSVINKYHSYFKITLEDVKQIDMDLDLYEFISILFLLFDTDYALQEIRCMIAAGAEHISRDKLFKWASIDPPKWRFKLLESLAVIQNYTILKRLGFSKRDIDIWRDNPFYLSTSKKLLYSICEFLNREQALELIERVRHDAKFKNDITLNCDPIFIEFHILFWMSEHYIDIDRDPYLTNLFKHLKSMNLFEINEVLALLNKTTNSKPNKSDIKLSDLDEECYRIIDPNNVGLCIVINMAHFKKNKEQRREFKNKLRDDLTDRKGSEADVENLRSTFEGLKFKFIVKNDIFHDRLINEIHNAVKANFEVDRHSVIVLCVLSHGDKGMFLQGVIYAANGIPVMNEDIINSISGYSPLIGLLAEIPKVIIIQACQGKKMLFVESESEPKLFTPDCAGGTELTIEDNDLKVDGPEKFDGRDTLICMATIRGFVAVRSTINGTIYIQELCRCLREFHTKKHFYDILTKVKLNLNNEKMYLRADGVKNRPVYMTPETTSTLRKHLYLTNKLTIERTMTV